MIQLSDAKYYVIYFVILIAAYVYFYYFSEFTRKGQRISSLLLANGVSSFFSVVFLSLLLPQFGWIAAVQVDPATLISLVIAGWDGVTYRDREAKAVPAPRSRNNSRSAGKSTRNVEVRRPASRRT